MDNNFRRCLLNPGPVTLTEAVRGALLRPDLCHREPDYSLLQSDVRDRLTRVYDGTANDYEAVLITGSGTAAVEAMIDSIVPRHGRALVVANGVYGQRMATMLERHGKPFSLVRAEWTQAMDLAAVEERLSADTSITHVLAVHHETTTGRLNDIAALGAICRRYGKPILLDAVSSFAGEPIDFRDWNVAAAAATANKCLHGVPGVSFVVAQRSILEQEPSAATSLYLDLVQAFQEQRQGGTPFTPAVQSVYALQEALKELDAAGGWRVRHGHYRKLSYLVREGLAALGIETLLENTDDHSSILTSFRLPAEVSFDELFHRLSGVGFVIYAGQKHLEGIAFRIAVMGDLDESDIGRLMHTFEEVLTEANSAAARI